MKTEDGSLYSLQNLPLGESVLRHSVKSEDLNGRSIYDYEQKQRKIIGDSYGTYIQVIHIPEDTKELTLKLTPVFKDMAPYLTDVFLQDAGMYMKGFFSKKCRFFASAC